MPPVVVQLGPSRLIATPNLPPVWNTQPAPPPYTVGQSNTTYPLNVTDPNSDPLTLTSVGTALPSGITLDSANKRLNIAGNALVVGATPTITIAASDGVNPPVSCTPFTITVQEATVPGPVVAGLTALYDGRFGAGGGFWNTSLEVRWERYGGSWLDTSGAVAGSTPYDSKLCNLYDGTVAFDATALVTKWRANGNTGFFLKVSAGNDAKFASRISTHPPTLSVTIGGTAYSCPCTAFAAIQGVKVPDSSEVTGVGAENIDFVISLYGSPGNNGAGQFDLSSLPAGTVSAASLSLYEVQYYGSAPQVQLFELNCPRIWTLTSEAPVAPTPGGIASGYDADVGIEAHADVIAGGDWSAGWSDRWNRIAHDGQTEAQTYTWPTASYANKPGSVANNKDHYQANPPLFVSSDPAFGGRTSFTWHYTTEENCYPGTGSNDRSSIYGHHSFHLEGIARQDETCSRFTIIPRGWPQTNQTNKYHLAHSYRAGYQRSSDGIWEGVTGNGGSPCLGVWLPQYGRPIASYAIGATSATVGGLAANTPYMISLGSGEYGYWINNGETSTSSTGAFVAGGMRAKVTGFVAGDGFASTDASGQLPLNGIEHWDVGTSAWLPGLAIAWNSTTPVAHFWSLDGPYKDNLLGNPANKKMGPLGVEEYGFYSGGSNRLTVGNVYTAAWMLRVAANVSVGSTTLPVNGGRPNVTGILQNGDTIWLNTNDAPNMARYTYSGLSLSSDASGNFSVAIADLSPAPTVPFTYNDYFDCMAAHRRIIEAEQNPYKDLFVCTLYTYHVEHAVALGGANSAGGMYGDSLMTNMPANGHGLLKADVMYDIELRTKLNSVVAPFDVYGNGTPVADGIAQLEINGIPVISYTNVKFRRNAGVQIDETWIDTTLGGSSTPRTVIPHGATLGPFVSAKSRIGRLKVPEPAAGLPAWRQQMLAPYTLYNLTPQTSADNSHTARVKYDTHPTYPTYGSNPAMAGFAAINTAHYLGIGAISEEMGTHGAWITCMNGHADTRTSIMPWLDLGTMKWKFPMPDSPTSAYYVASPGSINPPAGCDMFYMPSSISDAEISAAGYFIYPGTGSYPAGKVFDPTGAPTIARWAYPAWLGSIDVINTANAEYLPNVGSSARYDQAAVIPSSGGGEANGTLCLVPAPFGHSANGQGAIRVSRFGLSSRSWLAHSTNSERDMGGRTFNNTPVMCAYSEKYRKIYAVAYGSDSVLIYNPATNTMSRKVLNQSGGQANYATGNCVITNGSSGPHLLIATSFIGGGNYLPGGIVPMGLTVLDLDEVESVGSPPCYGIFPPGTPGLGSNQFARLQNMTWDLNTQAPGEHARTLHTGWAKSRKTFVIWQHMNCEQDGTWSGLPSDPYTGSPVTPPSFVLHTLDFSALESGTAWKTNNWNMVHHPLALDNSSATGMLNGGCRGFGYDVANTAQNMYKRFNWSEKCDCFIFQCGGNHPMQGFRIG